MKLASALIAASLLFGTPVYSQDRDDEYHREHRDQNYWAGHLFERIRADVDHIQSMTPFFSGEQFRLARTKQELGDLQTNAASGRFDDKDVDDVMNALQRVLAENRLSEHDRDMISDDMAKLREYREHHDRYFPR
jgi:hypothetical protein